MNRLKGHISHIEVSGSLSMVSVDIKAPTPFKSIVIETPNTAKYLQKGHAIDLLFKETEVILSTNTDLNISIENTILASVKHIELGTLLSKVTLDTKAGEITSVLSTASINQLGLKEHMQLMALVKMNEIMLSES